MIKRTLGQTGLLASELGFGCAGFWAKPAFPEKRALRLVHRAVERGVNLFDTGASYAGGLAERRLGKALREHRGEDILVATKAGSWIAENGRPYRDFSARAVRIGVEASLKRMGLDHVTLLHLHNPPAEVITDELLRCLEQLRQDGLVRFCGVSGDRDAVHRVVVENDVLSTVMFGYNLFRGAGRSTVVAELAAAGKGFLAATPIARAHWSGKLFRPTRAADFWYIARALRHHRDSVLRGFKFRYVSDYPGWTGAQIAIAYALSNSAVTSAIVGTTDKRHLDENIAASGRKLPREIIERIDAT